MTDLFTFATIEIFIAGVIISAINKRDDKNVSYFDAGCLFIMSFVIIEILLLALIGVLYLLGLVERG